MSETAPTWAGLSSGWKPGGERPRPPTLPHPFVQRLAHGAAACMGLFGLICLFTIDFVGPDLYTRSFIRDGLPVSYTEIHKNHGRLLFVSRGAVLFGVAAAILWLIWQFRSQSNVRALGSRGMRFRPTFTVLGWIIPGGNLLLPPLALRELWRASNPDALRPDEWRATRTSPIVWLWWLAILAGLALLVYAYSPIVGVHRPSVEALMTRDRFVRGAAAFGMAASFLGIVLVESINARLFGKMEALTASSWEAWRRRGGG